MSSGSGDFPVLVSLREELTAWLDRERAFNAARSVEEQRAVAAVMPSERARHPEVHALQCSLLLRAWPHRPPGRLPVLEDLPAPSRMCFARLSLLVEPESAVGVVGRSLPWGALLSGLDLMSAPEPSLVLRALVSVADDAPRAHALGALRALVSRGFVMIADAHALLLELLGSEDGSLRTWAFRELSAPWASGLPVPERLLEQGISAEDEAESSAAVEAAGARALLKLPNLLQRGPLSRQKALIAWAGQLGDADILRVLLDLALDDPAELGAPVFAALVALHHRGVFIREQHLASILTLRARGVSSAPDVLAGLCFVVRNAALKRMEALDSEDPDWAIWVPVCAAWLRAPRPPAEILPLLLRVGGASRRAQVVTEVLTALRSLAVDVACLPEGAREAMEALALSRLAEHPDLCLDLLEIVADRAAQGALLARSGWDDPSQSEEVLRERWPRVFETVWFATPASERAALLARARPSWITPLIRASFVPDLPASARDLLLRCSGVEDAEEVFVALTELAEPADIDEVARALQRVLEKAVAQPWRRSVVALGMSTEANKDVLIGGEERFKLSARCAEAVDAMEVRWRSRHRTPACLLAEGKRLLPELLFVVLKDARSAALKAGVLRSLLALDHPMLAAIAAQELSHADGDVAKLAARLLARGGAPWLSFELARDVESPDDRRARACLDAITAEPSTAGVAVALRCLSHRNMNIKRVAAEALGRAATGQHASGLFDALAQHDNPGLRAALKTALKRALGDAYVAGLLAAIVGSSGDERRTRWLIEALDGEIDIPLIRRLARRPTPWFRAILVALRDREIQLVRGSIEDLRAELVQAGLVGAALAPAPKEIREDLFKDAVEALFLEGFSPDRAEAVIGCWPDTLPSLQLGRLRTFLGPWLDWMVTHEDLRPTPLLRAVLAAPRPAEMERMERAAPALLALFERCSPDWTTPMFAVLEALLPRLSAQDRLGVGEILRRRLGDMPCLDRSPLPAIQRCGLLLQRADVERAFLGVRGVSDPAKVRRQILREAFGVSGSPLPEEARMTPSLNPHEAANNADLLSSALRAHTASALSEARAHWPLPPEVTLAALVHDLPAAAPVPEVLACALDWMESLRPIGVDAWSWPPVAPPNAPRPRPHEVPGLLDHEARLERLSAWLSGRLSRFKLLAPDDLNLFLPEEVARFLPAAKPERALEVMAQPGLAAALRDAISAGLLEQWERLSPSQRAAVASAREGRSTPVDLGWVSSEWHEAQRQARERLLDTEIAMPVTSAAEASKEDVARWFEEARGADEDLARQALSRLSERPDEAWRSLALALVKTGTPRVRHHVLRLIRKTLPQEDTNTAARSFLADEDASARRMAIRICSHGRDKRAVPEVVNLLLDPVGWVRREALAGLALMAEDAIPWVVRARDRARPDHASVLEQALSHLRSKLPD